MITDSHHNYLFAQNAPSIRRIIDISRQLITNRSHISKILNPDPSTTATTIDSLKPQTTNNHRNTQKRYRQGLKRNI